MRDFDPSLIHVSAVPLTKIGMFGKVVPELRDVGTAISVGASIVGGMMASDSAEDAANTQADAANQANATTQRMFNQTRKDLAPYRSAGVPALNKLQQLLGLSSSSGGGYGGYGVSRTPISDADLVDTSQGDWQPNQDLYDASPEYRAAVDAAFASHLAQFGTNPNYGKGSILQPFTQYIKDRFDVNGYNQSLSSKAAADETAQVNDPSYGSLLRAFTGKDLENDPGYQFGLNQGYQALDRRAASGGNYFSGAALKAANRYGQDYAGTKFNEAFNRDQTNKNSIYNMLMGQVNMGQNAASQTGTFGENAASNISKYQLQAGNALAAGQVGSANALNKGIGSAVDAFQWNQLLGKLK